MMNPSFQAQKLQVPLVFSGLFDIMKGMEIEKTNRMNALFEFYAALLTDKQMNYIELYYADDYSLAEIAERVWSEPSSGL